MTIAGPAIGPNAVHLCIDMQRMFAEATEWHTPTLGGIVPNVLRIAEAMRERTLFARFRVPESAREAKGSWQDYHRRWSSLTGERMDPALVDVVQPLAGLATPGRILDKPTYSLFENPQLVDRLAVLSADALVFTGVETDVCVLATLFDAIDRGFRAVVVSDAVTSSSLASHAAVLTLLLPRLSEQVAIVDTKTFLSTRMDRGRDR